MSGDDLGLGFAPAIDPRMSLADYSAGLWIPAPAVEGDRLTPLLDEALASMTDAPTRRAALAGWRRYRTLCTGPHVCPTYGPQFLAMDRVFTAGCPPDVAPIVGACAGIPCNNGARPLHLRFNGPLGQAVRPGTDTHARARLAERARAQRLGAVESRVPLGPGRALRRLVYGAPRTKRLEAALADLQPAARALVADPAEPTYSPWALRTVARIQSRVQGRPVVSIDVTSLVAAYLARVAGDRAHPLGRLFVDPAWRGAWCRRLPDVPWFLAPTGDPRRRPGFEPVYARGDRLVSDSRSWTLGAGVAELLAGGELCPGLMLTYAALVGVEGVRCIGGARHVIYMTRFASAWRELGLGVPARPGPLLAAGRAVDERGADVFPFDLALAGRRVAEVLPDDMPMERLWVSGGQAAAGDAR